MFSVCQQIWIFKKLIQNEYYIIIFNQCSGYIFCLHNSSIDRWVKVFQLHPVITMLKRKEGWKKCTYDHRQQQNKLPFPFTFSFFLSFHLYVWFIPFGWRMKSVVWTYCKISGSSKEFDYHWKLSQVCLHIQFYSVLSPILISPNVECSFSCMSKTYSSFIHLYHIGSNLYLKCREPLKY